jgi:hypothetical protein
VCGTPCPSLRNGKTADIPVHPCGSALVLVEVRLFATKESYIVENLGLCSELKAFEQGRIFNRATPSVTWYLSFFPISSQGLPHSAASYDTQEDTENLF